MTEPDREFEVGRYELDEDLLRELPPEGDPWRENELVRRLRIREDAARPLGANIAAGLALSEFAIKFKGAAAKKR